VAGNWVTAEFQNFHWLRSSEATPIVSFIMLLLFQIMVISASTSSSNWVMQDKAILKIYQLKFLCSWNMRDFESFHSAYAHIYARMSIYMRISLCSFTSRHHFVNCDPVSHFFIDLIAMVSLVRLLDVISSLCR